MNEDSFFKGIVALWVVGAIASVAFWGFVVWAIYQLVMHVTGG